MEHHIQLQIFIIINYTKLLIFSLKASEQFSLFNSNTG